MFVNHCTVNGIAGRCYSLWREKVMRFFGRRWLDYAAAPTIFAPANDLLVFSTASTNTITAVIGYKNTYKMSHYLFFSSST